MSVFASASAIVLVSNDGAEFSAPRDLMKSLSGFVGGAFMQDAEEDDNRLLVPLVDGATLQKVVSFCAHYGEERMRALEKPLASADLATLVQDRYVRFISALDKKELFELMLAAHFMDIRPLLDLCGAQIASFIKGQTAEKIRENLNISTDFSEAELLDVKSENKWMEDL